MVYAPFFSSKCSLFPNSNVFGCCIIHILYIYSTNIGTEYFKHGIYSPFFPSSKCSLFPNSNVFGSCIIHILYTGCAELKENNSGAKRLMSNRFLIYCYGKSYRWHHLAFHNVASVKIAPSCINLSTKLYINLDNIIFNNVSKKSRTLALIYVGRH